MHMHNGGLRKAGAGVQGSGGRVQETENGVKAITALRAVEKKFKYEAIS
jgi:hypothetical protein